jgi:ribosomal protein L28
VPVLAGRGNNVSHANRAMVVVRVASELVRVAANVRRVRTVRRMVCRLMQTGLHVNLVNHAMDVRVAARAEAPGVRLMRPVALMLQTPIK